LLGYRNFTAAIRGAPRLNKEENPSCGCMETGSVHEDDLLITAGINKSCSQDTQYDYLASH